MIYFKMVIFVILFFYFIYRTGIIVLYYKTKININSVNELINTDKFEMLSLCLYGFIFTVSLFQIIGIIVILLHTSFLVPYNISIILFLTLLIISYKNFGIKNSIKFLKGQISLIIKGENKILYCIVIFLVLAISVFSSYIFNENADDAYYVSLINQTIDSNRIYDNYEPSLGYGNDAQLCRYETCSYELFVSILSKISRIKPTIMCHTVLPFVFIILSIISYYTLINILCKNNENNKSKFPFVCLIFLIFIFLFEGTNRGKGLILLSRMWQGKAAFLNIILPIILSKLLIIYFNIKDFKNNILLDIVELTIINISGLFFTPVAIFIIPFSYIGFVCVLVFKKKIREIILLALTGIPVLISSVIMIFVTKNGGTGAYSDVLILDIFKEYIGNLKFFYLYLICVMYLLFKNDSRIKMYSIIIPLCYLCTIYNPLFTHIITKYLTGSNVFWRVFWLLPIEITISYTITKVLYEIKNKNIKCIVSCIMIGIIYFSGNFCYQEKLGFVKPENLEKIPSTIIKETEYILNDYKGNEKCVVLCPPEPLHSVTMRQLTSQILIFWSRDFYMLDIFGQEEYDNKYKLYKLYNDKEISVQKDEFIQLIKKYNIQYFIVPSEYESIIAYMDNIEVEKVEKIDNEFIYKFSI